MVRNIVVLGGNSHPDLVESICAMLNIPSCQRILGKFSGGESRCEIKDSVRGKDVYIIQSGSGKVNDHLIDLCIMISACKTGSAKRVTAVLPLFPYSRQPDVPYKKAGAPLTKQPERQTSKDYTFESVPATPAPHVPRTNGLNGTTQSLTGILSRVGSIAQRTDKAPPASPVMNGSSYFATKAGSSNGGPSQSEPLPPPQQQQPAQASKPARQFTTHDYENTTILDTFEARPGYKQWVAQSGTLVANLLTCAGADHIITMDLHDPQYQGFFDIPVDNLYGKPLLKRYIQQNIPNYREAVIVSPDAGGAKRATSLADSLQMDFALIHKERRPIKITDRQNATMMLVGDVAGRVCILVDDLADTANTVTRAAKLLKKSGATLVYALLTHGAFSGDAISRVNASAIDHIVVTNSVPQAENRLRCPKLQVLDVSPIFAEAIRRVHHGESISVLFSFD